MSAVDQQDKDSSIDRQQYQSNIWLQKVLANPEIYESYIDHTKCNCCGKHDIITKRKSRKKKEKKKAV
ncbi:MAG: hypothetical protein ACR2IS_19475 [Nitrososphaeraceae archaeon]